MTARALITGGAGFIGSHLAEALLDRGHSVSLIDDLSTGRLENIAHLMDRQGFHLTTGSISDPSVMDHLARECDTIFHLAAAVGVDRIIRDPLGVIETNVLGTHTVMQVASRFGKKVLLASTSEIYGKSPRVPFTEDDDRLLGPTTRSRWSYSTSKAVDEVLGLAYHRQRGLPVVIFRLFNTIGPRQSGQYGMVAPRFVEQALRGEPLTVYGDGLQTRCFCDVEDAVRAIIGLAESPQAVGQVFNVGSTHEVSILDLAGMVLRAVDESLERINPDHNARIVFVPYEQAYEEGFEDMRRRVPDIGRIRDAIGWEPSVLLEETLRRIVQSHRREISPTVESGSPGRHG